MKKILPMAILIFIAVVYIFPDDNKFDLTILDYAEKVARAADGIDAKYFLFKEIGEAYLQFGCVEKAEKLVSLIEDDYYRTSLLIDIIHYPHAPQTTVVESIPQKYLEFGEESFKADIWYNLIFYYLKRKDKNNVRKSLDEFMKLMCLDDCIINWERLMKLPGLLIEIGLKGEADKIVQEYLKLVEDNRVGLSSQMSVIKTLNLQGVPGDITFLINKVQGGVESISSIEDRALYCHWFAETLFEIDRLEDGYYYLKKSIGYANQILPRENRRVFIHREWVQSSRNDPGRLAMIHLIDEFESLLRDICFEEKEAHGEKISKVMHSVYEVYIALLIKKGKVSIASEIAKKDAIMMDIFNYVAALNFIDNQVLRHNALLYARKIKSSPDLKIGVMLEYRKTLGNVPSPEIYSLLDEAIKEANTLNCDRDEYLYKIAIAYLDMGDVKMADELYSVIKNIDVRSHIAFHIIQVCLREYSLSTGQKFLDKYTDITNEFRALCLSKIASSLYLENKVEQSIKMYKEAVDCMIKFSTSGISDILQDYYYAVKKEKRFYENIESHNFPVVD